MILNVTKWLDVMDGELSLDLLFGNSATLTRVGISRPGSVALLIPCWAASLTELPALIIPVLFGIAIVKELESVAYALFCGFAVRLSLVRGFSFRRLKFRAAGARTGMAQMSVRPFDVEGVSAILAHYFGNCAAAFPRTPARAAPSLIDGEGFTACLADAGNLFKQTFPPTFTATVLLLWLLGRDFKDGLACGARGCFHVFILP